MRPAWKAIGWASALAPSVAAVILFASPALGDEPGRLGRLFRFGGGNSNAAASNVPPAPGASPFGDASHRGGGSSIEVIPPPSAHPGNPGASPPMPDPSIPVAGATPNAPTGPQPRIIPQPRVSRAVSDADPLVTRISLGRSTEGNQFGMFLQVFADGTVIDSEGVHPLGRDAVRPVVEVVESGDLSRVRGHCGGPPTDYVEQVQMIVYERRLGGLRASSFSFTGNPQGCDHAVQKLQTALENLQQRIARTAPTAAPGASPTAPAAAPPVDAPASSVPLSPPIQLDVEPEPPSR